MNAMFTSNKTWLILFVLCVLGGIAAWQRDAILMWHRVRQLAAAQGDELDACAQKIAAYEEAAVPWLLAGLRDSDAGVCDKMQMPLVLMTKKWGHADARSMALMEAMLARFDEFSSAGQEQSILMATTLLQMDGPRPLPPRLTKGAGDLLLAAKKRPDLQTASLLLAAELIDCVEPGQWVDVGRAMAERGIENDQPKAKVAALRLLLRGPMRKDKDLLEKAILLLRDPAAAVRKNALLVLASESDLAREENLMPLLHDEDAEVQFLCENALRKRGLSDDDIKIARMISAREPATRMRVLHHLRRVPDVNLNALLRQMSHDPEKAVRAAAIRAAAAYPHVDLSARLREMAANDPSEQVRLNAQYYLQQRLSRAARD